MNNDIIPQKKPKKPLKPEQASPAPNKTPQDLPNIDLPDETAPTKKRSWPLKPIIIGILLIIGVAFIAAWLWYQAALSPVDQSDQSRKLLSISKGSTVSSISGLLKEQGLIRDKLAFSMYARSVHAESRLQAGEYSFSPSESVQEIIDHLVSGKVDQFKITFLPGATLRRLPGETNSGKTDIESALINAGYKKDEIEAAFKADYDHPLFQTRPKGVGLEGYIYGETYKFASSSSVEQILEATFDEYYKVIEKNDLIEGYKKQGLTLYQGITLASIIQREVSSAVDQKQVAQVFLDRLELGMPLGADATFEYGAKKDNVAASPDIDSPYNTRKYTGLPPGPISMPGRSALIAVANPAEGDYLYFVSGDNGKNYFSRTNEEHEANVRKYCQKLCFGQ